MAARPCVSQQQRLPASAVFERHQRTAVRACIDMIACPDAAIEAAEAPAVRAIYIERRLCERCHRRALLHIPEPEIDISGRTDINRSVLLRQWADIDVLKHALGCCALSEDKRCNGNPYATSPLSVLAHAVCFSRKSSTLAMAVASSKGSRVNNVRRSQAHHCRVLAVPRDSAMVPAQENTNPLREADRL
jgi:hypothetical protein